MNRKNTILLAVFINAGLLVVLFVTALTSQDEMTPSSPSSYELVTAPTPSSVPLFAEDIDISGIKEQPNTASAPQSEPPIVHQLPPLAPSTSEPIAAPPAPQQISTPPAAVAQENLSSDQIIVKKGDSLEKLAKEHKTTVDEIIKLNRLPSSFLRVGQILKMPPKSTAIKPPVTTAMPDKRENGPEYYTVKMGDNPWTIATKHQLKVEELLKLNGLNDEKARKLKPGDRLRIR